MHELSELRHRVHVFEDRADAGVRLSSLLEHYAGTQARVCAIPVGGLPVAMPISAWLGLTLDVAVVSKVTLPWNTESGYGAVACDGTVLLNQRMIDQAGLDADQIDAGVARTRARVTGRITLRRSACAECGGANRDCRG